MTPLILVSLFCAAVILLLAFPPKAWRSGPSGRQIVTQSDIDARGKLAAPQPWPNPPALSCFVQGIIRSLETEPEQWERGFVYDGQVGCWRHKTLGAAIVAQFMLDEDIPPLGGVVDYDLSWKECSAVYRALDKHVIGPSRLNATSQHTRDLATRKAAFEALACPPTTPPTT